MLDLDKIQERVKDYVEAANLEDELIEVINELRAARKVVDAARDALDDMDRMFRTTRRLEEALEKLDGENVLVKSNKD